MDEGGAGLDLLICSSEGCKSWGQARWKSVVWNSTRSLWQTSSQASVFLPVFNLCRASIDSFFILYTLKNLSNYSMFSNFLANACSWYFLIIFYFLWYNLQCLLHLSFHLLEFFCLFFFHGKAKGLYILFLFSKQRAFHFVDLLQCFCLVKILFMCVVTFVVSSGNLEFGLFLLLQVLRCMVRLYLKSFHCFNVLPY